MGTYQPEAVPAIVHQPFTSSTVVKGLAARFYTHICLPAIDGLPTLGGLSTEDGIFVTIQAFSMCSAAKGHRGTACLVLLV